MRQIVVISVLVLFAQGAPQQRLGGRIVGGSAVLIEDAPYQLSLERGGSHYCGAAILTETFAVTAAHCTDGSIPSDFIVRAGSSYKEDGGVMIPLAAIYQNELFDSGTLDNDISLLELAIPLTFGETIQPLKLPAPNQEVPGGQPAFVTGWGTISEDGVAPSVLQGVEILTYSHDACVAAYGDSITNQMICAGVDEGGKDSCAGDSGGPLVVNGELIGLVSWGEGCARPGKPGVYSKVPELRGFIFQIVGI